MLFLSQFNFNHTHLTLFDSCIIITRLSTNRFVCFICSTLYFISLFHQLSMIILNALNNYVIPVLSWVIIEYFTTYLRADMMALVCPLPPTLIT